MVYLSTKQNGWRNGHYVRQRLNSKLHWSVFFFMKNVFEEYCALRLNNDPWKVLKSTEGKCNSHYQFLIQTYPGLSKVAGCQRKSPSTWLVSAGYSAWHFFTWCFLNKISLDWPLTLTTQPSTSKFSDNPAYTSWSLPHLKTLLRHWSNVCYIKGWLWASKI